MENFVDVEFFEEKSSIMKHVHLLHCFMGGILYEIYATRKSKYLARGFAIFAYSTVIIGNVVRLIQQEESNFKGKEESLAQIIFWNVWASMVLIGYLRRGDFHVLFDLINHQDSLWKSNVVPDVFKELDVKKFNVKLGKYYSVWMAAACLGKLFQKISTWNFDEEFNVDYDWDFFVSFPFAHSQTLWSYISFYTLTMSFFLMMACIMYGSLVLPIILSMNLANQTKRLLNDIKYHSDLAFECLEECFSREQTMRESTTCDETVRQFQFREIARRRERHIEEFMIKVHQWIGIHQKWQLYAKFFLKSTTALLTVQIVGYMIGIISSGYHVLKAILDAEKVSSIYVFYLALNVILLLMVCAVGDPLREASDALPTAIYSTPWYHLPKIHQKVVLNFICMAQNNDEIRIFDTFPLSLELFPTILNDAYSYVQLMRIIEMKHRR